MPSERPLVVMVLLAQRVCARSRSPTVTWQSFVREWDRMRAMSCFASDRVSMARSIGQEHVDLAEQRRCGGVTHGIGLHGLALAVVGEAVVLQGALVAKGSERVPEVRRARLVGDARQHPSLL